MVESISGQGQTRGTYRHKGQPVQCNTSIAMVQEGQDTPSFPWSDPKGQRIEGRRCGHEVQREVRFRCLTPLAGGLA